MTFRGRDGPLRVTNPEPRDPLFAALIKAAGEVGIAHNPDYNGARQDGIAMSQATIANGRRMSTARCYLDPIRQRAKPAHRDRRVDRGCDARRQALHRRALFRRRRGARGPRCARGRGQRRHDQLAAAAGAVRHRPTRAPARSRDRRCAMPCRASARTCATITRRAPAGLVGAKGITFNDRGRGLGLVHQALRYCCSARACWHGGGADARLRPLPRRPGGAGSAAGLGAHADRAGTEGAEDLPPIRRDVLRASDAAGKQGAHPHHRGRSAPAARHQLQLPVVADRRGAHRARDPHRPRRHDRAGDGPDAGDGDRTRHRRGRPTTKSSTGSDGWRRRPTIRSAPARWARTRWRWSTTSCACAASRGCGSPMPRSCRRSPRATPTRRRS